MDRELDDAGAGEGGGDRAAARAPLIVDIWATTAPAGPLISDTGVPVLLDVAAGPGLLDRIGGWVIGVLIRNLGRGPGAHRGNLDH